MMGISGLFTSTIMIVYAVTILALLLDVHPARLSVSLKIVFWGGILLVIVVANFLMINMEITGFAKFYPLLVQLPVYAIFLFTSGHGYIKTFFSLITAIFLSFPFRILTRVLYYWGGTEHFAWVVLGSVAGYAFLVSCIYFLMKPSFNYAMRYLTNLNVLKCCLIPVFYNIAAYYLGKYTITQDLMPIRILLFLSALAAYFLLMDIFRVTMEQQRLQHENGMISMEIQAAKQQLCDMKSQQEQAVLYRHDMRHHFALINSYLDANEPQKASSYIKTAQAGIESFTPHRYCENETVNLILSSFAAKAQSLDVILSSEAVLPEYLAFDDTELCTLLSNALENAISAAAEVKDSAQKQVRVQCLLHKEKLLLLTENPYTGTIIFEDGLPRAKSQGHGFGAKSMVAIVKKHGGEYFFEPRDGIFTVKLMLPLGVAVKREKYDMKTVLK